MTSYLEVLQYDRKACNSNHVIIIMLHITLVLDDVKGNGENEKNSYSKSNIFFNAFASLGDGV